MADTELQNLVGETHGLPPAIAELLQGANLAEMSAHAQRLAAVTRPAAAAPGPESGFDGGAAREAPKMDRDYVLNIAKTDPRRFNAMVDDGSISLDALR